MIRPIYLFLWALISAAIGLSVFVVWWALTPSETYVRVLGYSVEKIDGEWIASSARDLPQGTILADWSVTFIVISPEHTFLCQKRGQDVYEEGLPQPVSYTVSPWADECLDSGMPVTVTVSRTVRLLDGLIPLRPATFGPFQVLPPPPRVGSGPVPPGLR